MDTLIQEGSGVRATVEALICLPNRVIEEKFRHSKGQDKDGMQNKS